MGRRTITGAMAGSIVVASLAAKAQQARRIYRIGVLGMSSVATSPWWAAFLQRLRECGWIGNQNFVTERLFTEQMGKTSVALPKELEARHVDVIVVTSTESALAAKQASSTIPMVMANVADPVSNGLVASLAHRGGNITGISFQGTELAGKQLDLLVFVIRSSPASRSRSPHLRSSLVASPP